MNQRPSLMDQAGIKESPASEKSSGGGGLDASKVKLIGVGALLVLAGVLIAWQMGVFSSPPKPNKQQQAQRQEQMEQQIQEEQKEAATTRQRRTNAGG